MRQLSVPSEQPHLPRKPSLAPDQIAYQAAYQRALGQAIEAGYNEVSTESLARLLGRLDGQATFLRELLERRRNDGDDIDRN